MITINSFIFWRKKYKKEHFDNNNSLNIIKKSNPNNLKFLKTIIGRKKFVIQTTIVLLKAIVLLYTINFIVSMIYARLFYLYCLHNLQTPPFYYRGSIGQGSSKRARSC